MTKAKFRVAMDMAEIHRAIQKVELLPRQIAAQLRKTAIPKAANELRRVFYANVPMGNDEDRALQSRSHKAKWAGVPDVVASIDFAIRPWDRVNTSVFVGPELTDRGGKSPGNKMFFDYMGTTDRMMSFWAKEGSKNYRKRRKTKIWIAKMINDTETPRIVSMLMSEVNSAFAQSMKK